MAGRKIPTAGNVEIGPTAVIGYYDQRGVELDLEARVRDLVAGPTRRAGDPQDVALMERFWFTGELPFARAGTLSGGERRRLQLLLVLASRPNVLLLDEPTNDLDLDTLRILEDFFEDWPGALVVVSHDRTFLSRATERLVSIESGGLVQAVPGGLDAWVARSELEGATGSVANSAARTRSAMEQVGASRAGAGSAGSAGSGASANPPADKNDPARQKANRILRDIDKEISRLRRKREQLHLTLADTTDHVRLKELGSDLSAVQADLDDAEERWLSVAEEAESS
jgi:ATP-binding cassette subfamily F protein uup